MEQTPSQSMYLTSIEIQNLGPISRISFKPFVENNKPKPLVIVGPNGSGKTTLLSTIVSSLITLKQQAFENTEVDAHKVFRLRGNRFLRRGESYYYWQLEFTSELMMTEWCLNQNRKNFEASNSTKPTSDGWKQIPADQHSGLFQTPNPKFSLGGNNVLSSEMQERFRENVVLYFSSDRFEPPDWLNSESLRSDLAFQYPENIVDRTNRTIFSKSLLKPTLEWLRGVILDRYLSELRPIPIPLKEVNQVFTVQTFINGPHSKLINIIARILGEILNTPSQSIAFNLGNRTAPSIGITIDGQPAIPDLLSLSAGQSALFCIFCAILRDYDLAKNGNVEIDDIKGIVVIDEADLHLHLDLQHRALPELIKLFSGVQFILTAHSPTLVIGLDKQFGNDGVQLLEMPNGIPISCELYSEFDLAFKHFAETQRFKAELFEHLKSTRKPILIVEGETDRIILETAWNKLETEREIPFEIHSCGESRLSKGGGAKTLYALIEAVALYETRPILGLFDNDREGAEQFNSLNEKKSFKIESDLLRKHSKGYVSIMILPPPPGRELFSPKDITHRLLEIEHYFSDTVLENFQAVGEKFYESPVFVIRNSAKNRLAQGASTIDAADFTNFKQLFSAIERVLKTRAPEH